MKRTPFWLVAAGALLLTGCGSTATNTPADSAAPAAAPTTALSESTAAPAVSEPTAASAAAEPTNVPAAAEPTGAPAAAAATPAATTAPAAADTQVFTIVPEESTVTYEVGEVFINRGNQYAVAIGSTQEVSGEITFDQAAPQNSKVGKLTIDISTFKSDSERRDGAIRDRWLESATFPKAEFTPIQIEGLPATYAEGQEITLQITGDLLVREVTKPVVFEVKGKIENGTMTGTATSQIKMTDFGFDPPDILNILKAEDDVKIKFDFIARS